MNLNGKTSDEEILNFTDEFVCFWYVHSLKMDTVPDINELKEKVRNHFIQFCMEWRDKKREVIMINLVKLAQYHQI